MRRLVSFFLLCVPAYTFAVDFYTELAINAVQQGVEDEQFKLASGELRAGAYVQPQIGLELFAGAGLVDDEQYGLTQSISQSYGIAARFESPMVSGTKAFILLGYAATELNLKAEQGPAPGKELFEGFSYGIGLEQQLFNPRSNWYLNGRWQSYYSQGEFDIGVFGVGFRYQF